MVVKRVAGENGVQEGYGREGGIPIVFNLFGVHTVRRCGSNVSPDQKKLLWLLGNGEKRKRRLTQLTNTAQARTVTFGASVEERLTPQ